VIKARCFGRRASVELGLRPVQRGMAIVEQLSGRAKGAEDHLAGMEFFGVDGLGVLVDVHFRAGSAESQAWREPTCEVGTYSERLLS
jgi:hypothetical protein